MSQEPADPILETLRIGDATIHLHQSGITRTCFPDGEPVLAYPQDTDQYRATAVAQGYGDDVLAMSRDNDLLHSLICSWLGLPRSPTLNGCANRPYWPDWWREEETVMALQRLARFLGVDLLEVARRRSAEAGNTGRI